MIDVAIMTLKCKINLVRFQNLIDFKLYLAKAILVEFPFGS